MVCVRLLCARRSEGGPLVVPALLIAWVHRCRIDPFLIDMCNGAAATALNVGVSVKVCVGHLRRGVANFVFAHSHSHCLAHLPIHLSVPSKMIVLHRVRVPRHNATLTDANREELSKVVQIIKPFKPDIVIGNSQG